MSFFTALGNAPLSVRLFLVVLVVLAVDLLFAVYAESALAAALGWPLITFAVIVGLVVVFDGIRRVLA